MQEECQFLSLQQSVSNFYFIPFLSRCDICCITFRTHRGLLRHNAVIHKQLPRDPMGKPFIQNNPSIPAGFHDLGFTDFSCRKFPRISQVLSVLHSLRYQLIQSMSSEFIVRLVLDEAETGCRIFCGKHITAVCVGFKYFLPSLFLFSSKEYLGWFISAFQWITIGVKIYKNILKENFGGTRSLPLPACPLVLFSPKPSHI